MEEFDEDVLENEEIIANLKKFLRDGCGCSRGVFNVNCLELTRAKKRQRSFKFPRVSQQIYFSVGKTTF